MNGSTTVVHGQVKRLFSDKGYGFMRCHRPGEDDEFDAYFRLSDRVRVGGTETCPVLTGERESGDNRILLMNVVAEVEFAGRGPRAVRWGRELEPMPLGDVRTLTEVFFGHRIKMVRENMTLCESGDIEIEGRLGFVTERDNSYGVRVDDVRVVSQRGQINRPAHDKIFDSFAKRQASLQENPDGSITLFYTVWDRVKLSQGERVELQIIS